jgi:hypothetical protein
LPFGALPAVAELSPLRSKGNYVELEAGNAGKGGRGTGGEDVERAAGAERSDGIARLRSERRRWRLRLKAAEREGRPVSADKLRHGIGRRGNAKFVDRVEGAAAREIEREIQIRRGKRSSRRENRGVRISRFRAAVECPSARGQVAVDGVGDRKVERRSQVGRL